MNKILIFFLVLTSIDGFAGQDPVKYRWPLNINNGFSSSFQEFRSNHFHAGLDLRTYQKTGYPVYAISDGQIYKMRVVKRGSGRGLYLQHRDGNTSIYFHLDHFNDKIETMLKKIQKQRKKKYIGNHLFKKPIKIRQGELIGYSGESGYGFPHLHLEIRDPEYAALNPFKIIRFPGKDRNRPIIKSLLLRPRAGSLINGHVGEQWILLKKINHHSYTAMNKVIVSGGFDMVLNTYDIADTGKHVAPYQISASLNDFNFFQLTFNKFTRDDNNQLGFVYDMFNSRSGSYFFNLFFQEGYELENQKINYSSLFKRQKPGEMQLKAVVKDQHLNQVTALIPVYKIPRPLFEVNRIENRGDEILLEIENLRAYMAEKIEMVIRDKENNRLYSGELDQHEISEKKQLILKGIKHGGHFLDFVFKYRGIVYSNYRFLLDHSDLYNIKDIDFDTYINRDELVIMIADRHVGFDNILLEVKQGHDTQLFHAETSKDGIFFHFRPSHLHHKIYLNFKILSHNEIIKEFQKSIVLIQLQQGKHQQLKWMNFEAEFHQRSVRESRLLVLKQTEFQSEYPILSRQVNLTPHHFPFLDTVFYKFRLKELPVKTQQVGIFKYNYRTNKWYYRSTTFTKNERLFKTRLISSGTFALMRDIFPPKIYFSYPRSKYKKRIKRLRIRITDKGKGINDYTLKVWLNGKKITCEYDPDWKHVILERPASLKVGRNALKVQIKDYAGNLTTRQFHFNLQ